MIRFRLFVLLALLGACLTGKTQAGPPYVTDDPEPVEYQHWELDFAVLPVRDATGVTSTAPHLEINYGIIPNVQLHVLTPMVVNAPTHERTQYGYGDTELGAKIRFLEETDSRPQIAIYPTVELPTGDQSRGLGNGKAQVYLPVWIQKSFGPWTTYGGGGYWFNPGEGNHDWWYSGWLLQRKITSNFAAAVEVFHETPKEIGGSSDTKFSVGGIYDFNDTWHLLVSAGHTIQGPSATIGYLGIQLTFGPEKKPDKK